MSVASGDRLPFPAVTVCNMNPVPRSRLLCSNFDLATIDEHLSNYVQMTNQNNSLAKHIHESRFNTAPISKCSNITHFNAFKKRSVADDEEGMKASSETNVMMNIRDIEESSNSIMVELTTASPTTTLASFDFSTFSTPIPSTLTMMMSTISISEMSYIENTDLEEISETFSIFEQTWEPEVLHDGPAIAGTSTSATTSTVKQVCN